MTAPTPYQLPEGEALYRASDLNDHEWEVRAVNGARWFPPSAFFTHELVVARRKKWLPKPGDRVKHTAGFGSGVVLAVHEPSGLAWVLFGAITAPYTFHISYLSPVQS